jgi:hypothetical protein
MTNEIIDKLTGFLNLHMRFSEECHAVYLLVEIRKLLDREQNTAYPRLRFYANWSVHTDKDTTPQIRATMESVLRDIKAGIAANDLDAGKILRPFVFMDDLRGEFQNFLAHYGLPTNLVDEGWPSFRDLLTRVLVDQPIKNPCVGIQRFAFTLTGEGHLIGEVNYETNPGRQDRLIFE